MPYHVKTGRYYEFLGVACDATNGSEKAEPMAVYRRRGQLFVRRLKEFLEKFALSPLELDEVKNAMSAAEWELAELDRLRKLIFPTEPKNP